MDTTWYWTKGLHDADIIDALETNLEYDYTLKNPIRNCLELIIDSKHAMFETSIKGIKFYNFKILSDLTSPKGIWWLKDELKEVDGKFVLTITGHQREVFSVRFESIDVVR